MEWCQCQVPDQEQEPHYVLNWTVESLVKIAELPTVSPWNQNSLPNGENHSYDWHLWSHGCRSSTLSSGQHDTSMSGHQQHSQQKSMDQAAAWFDLVTIRSWSQILNHNLLINGKLRIPQTNMLVMLVLLTCKVCEKQVCLLLTYLAIQIGLNQINSGVNTSTQEKITRGHISGCMGSWMIGKGKVLQPMLRCQAILLTCTHCLFKGSDKPFNCSISCWVVW